MGQFLDKFGYFCVSVRLIDKIKKVRVHRLVAELFIPNDNKTLHVHHIDGNCLNNSVNNLLWISPEDHGRLGKLLQRKKDGVVSPITHSDETIIKIRRLYQTGEYTQTQLAKIFKVSQVYISDIVNYELRHDI